MVTKVINNCKIYSEIMMKRRIIYLDSQGIKSTSIVQILIEKEFKATAPGVVKFLKNYKSTGTVERKCGSGRPSIKNDEMLEIIEHSMINDDETTTTQVQKNTRKERTQGLIITNDTGQIRVDILG
jgi:transposase